MSTEPKFSPGPWAFVPRDETPGYREPVMVNTGGGMWQPMGDRNAEANAHLISAAPNLFAELHRITNHLEEWARYHSDERTAETDAAIHCARAALSKALGGAV
ncbi:MAG: hypothetical protein E5Y10_24560 [Mesorhizobium sp.]|nr:MAG: hypothetical protein E5Y10_24560 [Mesorhizobium sp.]